MARQVQFCAPACAMEAAVHTTTAMPRCWIRQIGIGNRIQRQSSAGLLSFFIAKGGSAGFLGKAYDPYRMYQDSAKPIKLEDLSLSTARCPNSKRRWAITP